MRSLAALLVVAAVAAGPAPARSSPLSDPTTGRAVFTGAASPHPSSIQLNPAALGIGLPGWHIYASGNGTLDRVAIDRKVMLGDSGALSPGPSVTSLDGSWGFSVAAWDVNPKGLYASAGAVISLTPSETYPSGHALRYHTRGGRYREIPWITAGGALRATGKLSFGVSAGVVYSSLHLAFARDTALDRGAGGLAEDCGSGPCGIENEARSEDVSVKVRSNKVSVDGVVVSVGALYQVAPDWWIALTYRSPQGFGSALQLTGDAVVTRPPGTCSDVATDPNPCVSRGSATVAMDLPQSVHAALRGRIFPGLDLTANLGFENLSRLSQYDVRIFGKDVRDVPEWNPRPRGLRNVFSGQVGVEQVDRGQALTFGGRVGVETGAVSSERISPLQVEGLSITGDLGVQYRILPGLVLQLAAGVAFYPEVQSRLDSAYDPRAVLRCEETNHDYDTAACAAVRTGYALPTAAGDYRRISGATRLGLRYDFL